MTPFAGLTGYGGGPTGVALKTSKTGVMTGDWTKTTTATNHYALRLWTDNGSPCNNQYAGSSFSNPPSDAEFQSVIDRWRSCVPTKADKPDGAANAGHDGNDSGAHMSGVGGEGELCRITFTGFGSNAAMSAYVYTNSGRRLQFSGAHTADIHTIANGYYDFTLSTDPATLIIGTHATANDVWYLYWIGPQS